MIFKNEDGKLQQIKQLSFKLEKDLQHLVETNMFELFNLEFLTTEFAIDKFRFDSVAFDNENNTFIIIEYKRGLNESLVDQGYAYLRTVIDRKAELVLLYNEKKHDSKLVKDFDWHAIRIYFVSPKFTIYQRKAVGYEKMPFKLFEINQYDNGLIYMNEIKDDKVKDEPIINVNDKNSHLKTNIEKDIIVYSENDHIENASDLIKELYENIRDKALQIKDFEVVPTKLYIAFKLNNKNIFDIEFYKKFLKISLNISKGHLDDPYNKTKDISSVGHHGNGDYEFQLNKFDDIDYLLILVKQVLKFYKF